MTTEAPLRLTDRERELVPLIARGLTIAEAADAMGVSNATAVSFAKALRFKLHVQTTREVPAAYMAATGDDPYPRA